MARETQEPTRVEKTGVLKDSTTYVHPAYGQIGVSRVSGHTSLYGSDFEHNGYMVVSISTSELRRDLARDWHFADKEIIEVALSEAQWATFLSSPNIGSGVPCTIQFQAGNGMIPGLPHRDEAKEFADEGKAAIKDFQNKIAELTRDLIEGPLSGLSQTKARVVTDLLREAMRDVLDRLPFVEDQFDKHVENRIEKAKVEIHGWMNSTIQRAGLQAIANERGVPLQIEGQKDVDGDGEVCCAAALPRLQGPTTSGPATSSPSLALGYNLTLTKRGQA